MAIVSLLCFPGFLTIFFRFPWYFPMFPLVFLRFSQVYLVFLLSVSRIFYFKFYDYAALTFSLFFLEKSFIIKHCIIFPFHGACLLKTIILILQDLSKPLWLLTHSFLNSFNKQFLNLSFKKIL